MKKASDTKKSNPITKAIGLIGLVPLATACGVKYQSLRKWEARGKLPRTAYTGEKHYAQIIEDTTGGAVTKQELLDIN
jgi:hypothetical protein